MKTKLSHNEIKQVIDLSNEYIISNTRWRKGQSFFNALNNLFPITSEDIRATIYDPFYDDKKIESCIKFISESAND